MKYVALLRGINVGGKNLLKMADIRVCLERNAFTCVTTYIQSGNIIFESALTNTAKITAAMENALSAEFGYQIPVFLLSQREMTKVIADAPREWSTRKDLRCYLAFLRKPLTARQAMAAMNPQPGVDSVKAGDRVVYMTTVVARAQESGFRKVVAQDIYRQMTVRNFNTSRKILSLMEAQRT